MKRLAFGMNLALAAPAMAGPRLTDFRAEGVELAQDTQGLRITLPIAHLQDSARDKLVDRDFMAL